MAADAAVLMTFLWRELCQQRHRNPQHAAKTQKPRHDSGMSAGLRFCEAPCGAGHGIRGRALEFCSVKRFSAVWGASQQADPTSTPPHSALAWHGFRAYAILHTSACKSAYYSNHIKG